MRAVGREVLGEAVCNLLTCSEGFSRYVVDGSDVRSRVVIAVGDGKRAAAMMCLAAKASSGQLTMSGLRIHFRSVAPRWTIPYFTFDSMAQDLLFSKTYITLAYQLSHVAGQLLQCAPNNASSTQHDVCVIVPVARVIQAVLSLYMHDIQLNDEHYLLHLHTSRSKEDQIFHSVLPNKTIAASHRATM